jgi:hypothetical protein
LFARKIAFGSHGEFAGLAIGSFFWVEVCLGGGGLGTTFICTHFSLLLLILIAMVFGGGLIITYKVGIYKPILKN